MLRYKNMFPSKKTAVLGNVHSVLAYSYGSYFISFILGLLVHIFFPIQIYQHAVIEYLGLLFLLLASLLILWAQMSSRKLEDKQINKEAFCRGPYCYTRMPTHWGLFFLMFGFGLMINSLFVVLFTLAFFVFTKLFFIRKQEAILVSKYGKPYEEYKESVKL